MVDCKEKRLGEREGGESGRVREERDVILLHNEGEEREWELA